MSDKEERLSPGKKDKEERLSPGPTATRRVIRAEMTRDGGKPAFTIEMDVTPPPDDCTCYQGGLHSPGSVASIRAGDTDPDCPHHGVN